MKYLFEGLIMCGGVFVAGTFGFEALSFLMDLQAPVSIRFGLFLTSLVVAAAIIFGGVCLAIYVDEKL